MRAIVTGVSAASNPTSVRSDGVRRRPKDRKAQIARVAAEAFSVEGYHAVSMESIAAQVGISATALYRHYSGKYELFRDSVLTLGQLLADSTDPGDSPATLEGLVAALVDTTIANRPSGGLYRWEGRYLDGEDQDRLMAQVRTIHRRLHGPILVAAPGLDSVQKWTLSTAVLSVIGSIADHRARLPVGQIRTLLTELACAVASAQLPARDPGAVRPERAGADVGRYEALLRESMRLFDTSGYAATSMEDIAAAAGIPTSGIYRYFGGKSDLLAAALRRAADGVSAELARAATQPGTPAEVLVRSTRAYVQHSLAHPELANVYYTERVNLPAADAAMLVTIQRSTVESWLTLLQRARPDISTAQARFVVHAAMALVIDLGRLSGHDPATWPQVQCLVELTLFGADPADATYRALRAPAAPRYSP